MIVVQGHLTCADFCYNRYILTRQIFGSDLQPQQETICITTEGGAYKLIGADSRSGLELLGPAFTLVTDSANPDESVSGAAYDAFSASVYYTSGDVLYRLNQRNRCTLVAGNSTLSEEDDGPARPACFSQPSSICCTGRGDLYVLERLRIRKVQLPESWREGRLPDEDASEVTVTILTELPETIVFLPTGFVYLARGDSLVFSTHTALYRVQLNGAAAGASGALQAELLAGVEGSEGSSDGVGGAARFQHISGLTVDAVGCIYAIDGAAEQKRVRKVTPDGTVSTVVQSFAGFVGTPAILPNGYLAVCSDEALHFLDLGLMPRRAQTAAEPGPLDPPPRPLAADLGALLQRQLDGTADVTIVVGDRSFPAHRAILAARCEYFRQWLEAGFEDSRAPALAGLPDADPDVFSLLLRFIYTGAVDIPSKLLRPVAELADRLLLTDLRGQAEAQLLAEVTPETLADLMLWAEARPQRCSAEFLKSLRCWYVEYSEEVLERAPKSMTQLMVERPKVVLELMQVAQRRRLWRVKRQRLERDDVPSS